jgi:hypothetical protein
VSLELVYQSEVVVAWRNWSFHWVEDRGFSLTSVCQAVPYPVGLAQEAVCTGERSVLHHRAPDEECDCGVYGVPADRFAVLEQYSPWPRRRAGQPFQPRWLCRDRVVGTVSLWGEVLECEQGYRAQYAYPREILVPEEFRSGGFSRQLIISLGPDDAATLISSLYGIPATVLPDAEIKRMLDLA